MRAVVTGGTGLVGRELVSRLERAIVLTRDPSTAKRKFSDLDARPWLPQSGPPPADSLRGAEVVFNLAGEPVAAGRWTAAKKKKIETSVSWGPGTSSRVLRRWK